MSIKIPQHIAIIMDGNRTWARDKGLSRLEGYEQGIARAENIAEYCQKLGVKFLTLFAFSSENWRRNYLEVEEVMEVLYVYLKNRLRKKLSDKIKINFFGNTVDLPIKIQKLIAKFFTKEDDCLDKIQLNIALSYGGQDEIRTAAAHMAQHYSANFMQTCAGNLLNSLANYVAGLIKHDDTKNKRAEEIKAELCELLNKQGQTSVFDGIDVINNDKSKACGKIIANLEQIKQSFDDFINKSFLPAPDLLIRTSGKMRISNFLLWHIAYTELFFSPVNWPDFTPAELDQAIASYSQRERTFGAV